MVGQAVPSGREERVWRWLNTAWFKWEGVVWTWFGQDVPWVLENGAGRWLNTTKWCECGGEEWTWLGQGVPSVSEKRGWRWLNTARCEWDGV